VCTLYSITKGQQAIRQLSGAMNDRTGNLPPLPGIFPVGAHDGVSVAWAECKQTSAQPKLRAA
jgi:hypothetical protein